MTVVPGVRGGAGEKKGDRGRRTGSAKDAPGRWTHDRDRTNFLKSCHHCPALRGVKNGIRRRRRCRVPRRLARRRVGSAKRDYAILSTLGLNEGSLVAKKTKSTKKVRIGIVDTMFARYDMGGAAVAELEECPGYAETFSVVRQTVPGFKDLAVAAMNLIKEQQCSIVVALGMPGGAAIDKQCAHEASLGIMQAQLMTSTPILEVFVYEDESDDPAVIAKVFEHRSRSHARNAYWMLFEPDQLRRRAGQGIRQGFDDAGPLDRM